MPLNNPADAMPWVGLYVAGASLACILGMTADVIEAFRQHKFWFPCRLFTLNAATITLIAIATKVMVDLTSIPYGSVDEDASVFGISFLIAMLANFLPSLGDMGDRELLYNMIALSILMITITVNEFITFDTNTLLMLSGILVLSVALTVPAVRRHLDHQYNELHEAASSHHQIDFSTKELAHHVKKYWVMAETDVCHYNVPYGQSAYKWSINVIVEVQLCWAVTASIAPTVRCFTAIGYFNLSKKDNLNNLNIFKVSGYSTQRLQHWKSRTHVLSHIRGRHCRNVFQISKNVILDFCIALQIMAVVTCNIMSLPRSLMLLIFSCFQAWWRASLKRSKENVNVSNFDAERLEMKEYASYVLQMKDNNAELSQRVLKLSLKCFNQFLKKTETKEPRNLIKLLEKSTGCNGVLEFDNDQVPPLHSEETKNSWSLVVVTLTAIVVALPNKAGDHGEGLLASMGEGLQIVSNIEECINAESGLVKSRKAARRVSGQNFCIT